MAKTPKSQPTDAVEPEVTQMVDTTSDEIAQLKKQVETLDTNWKRALADYQNLVRRIESDKKEFMRINSANLIARLLPALDVIEMAAKHTKDVGVDMAAKQLAQALNQEGLIEIAPSPGDAYDPHLHECTEIVESTSDQRAETIAELVLKGYKLGDFVLRPARVKVYKASEQN